MPELDIDDVLMIEESQRASKLKVRISVHIAVLLYFLL